MIAIISLLLYLNSPCSADMFSFMYTMMTSKDKAPEKVRTVEERDRRKSESVVLDFIGIVQQYEGYTAEEYNVTTEDGYILGLHRITGSPIHPKSENKKVVYIQHGLFGSSDLMIMMGPQKSIAFELVDAGYDVWLGNVRGNTYSRAHTKYLPDLHRYLYWNFRMDDMALKDLPTFIDFILEKTNQKKLTYIGFSMGTTLSFMLLSSKIEYNDKINLVVNLAPVVYFSVPSNMKVVLLMNAILTDADFRFRYELMPHSKATYEYAKSSCSNGTSICSNFFSIFADESRMNLSMVPEIIAHSPGGTSYYTVKQYQQLIAANGRFPKYDYGCRFRLSCKNGQMYYQDTPPEYDLSLVTAPIALFFGQNDIFAKVSDVELLKSKLSNVTAFEKVPDPLFNHLDFIWNNEAKSLVYDRVLKVIKENV